MNDKEQYIKKMIEMKTGKNILPENICFENPVFNVISKYVEIILQKECVDTKFKEKIKFYFLIDRHIDALSIDIQGTRVLCMTTGAVELIPSLIYEMSECKGFFLDYNSHMPPEKIINELISYVFLLLVLHECGHIFQGHVQYLNGGSASSVLAFGNRISHIQQSIGLEVKTLEYAADVYAAEYMSKMFLSNCPDQETLIDKIKNIYAATLFLHIILAIFNKDKNIEVIYLPFSSRINELFVRAYIKVHKFDIDINQIEKILKEVYPTISIALFRMTKIKSVDLVNYQDKEAITKELREIENHWETIAGDVLKFSIWEV